MYIATLLMIVGSAIAVSTSVAPPKAAADPTIAVPRKLLPATPPTAKNVADSMANWVTSVNTVNAWLDDPTNTTKLSSAIVFAQDEPKQLATLMKTPKLSVEGMNSAKILVGNFPSIVANLKMAQTGVMSTDQSTAAINFDRCCTVLPAIGGLWAAAADASNVQAMPPPNQAGQCSAMSCASGTSLARNSSKVVLGKFNIN